MSIAQSRVTAQGQISVPAEIRKILGIGPGSVLEWDQEEGKIVVRKKGTYTSEDIRRMLFGDETPRSATDEELKEGIRTYMRNKYASR